jgi:hypothetical protein
MRQSTNTRLNLRVGELVEVRNEAEILSTLDVKGCVDGLPFMPEMLKHCGHRFRVYKSAHKTCDTIQKTGLRRMQHAVHLEGLRCGGEFHSHCQAGCLLFWKEAWLKRVPNCPIWDTEPKKNSEHGCTGNTLLALTRSCDKGGESDEEVFSCQATELRRATSPLRSWDPRQYVQDLLSRNVTLSHLLWVAVLAIINMMLLRLRGRLYPGVEPRLPANKTPRITLGLKPGELVEVRSKEEIEQTLGANSRNRGLWFDVEMLPYCDRQFRVLRRVERLIDEKSGKMIHLSNDCIILDGVTCSGDYSYKRRFCPRGIYPYWREIWLKRVD